MFVRKTTGKYFLFLALVMLLTVPFYAWSVLAPVSGLPFGLPIAFLAIIVPFGLSLFYAWKEGGRRKALGLFRRIFDWNRAKPWALVFSVCCMPLVAVGAFYTMRLLSLPLPARVSFPRGELPLMLLLYFLGAIPEEFGWTATLTEPLAKAYGPVRAGILIGAVWAIWHILLWRLAHPWWWVAGMCVYNIFARTAMVYLYEYGGRSLFAAVVFHAMINVSMGAFPNSGSHMNPWVFAAWMAACFLAEAVLLKRKQPQLATH